MKTAGELGPQWPQRLWINTQEWGLGKVAGIGTHNAPAHLLTGLRGEQAALFELRRRGMVIVARRWSSPRLRGDVDLIGWQAGTLCFIEVKTRTARDLNPAEQEVDDDKRRILRSLAHAYLRSFPAAERTKIPVRFDVVSVYLMGAAPEFDYFPGAFGRQ